MVNELATYRVDGSVAVITLNRPEKHNALNSEVKEQMMSHFRAAEEDKAVSVVVLRGNGKSFCAGADLSGQDDRERIQRRTDGLKALEHHSRTLAFHLEPWSLAQPVIASVHGHVLGAGCELAMMCDLTIAADSAVFGEPEIRFGSIGSPVIMPWIIGHKRARELLYMGDTIDAKTAMEIGMVNRVVPSAELEAETMRYAKRLGLIGKDILAAAKLAINRGIEAMGFRTALDAGLDIMSLVRVSKTAAAERFGEIVKSDGLVAAFKKRHGEFD